jgi:RNA polymerase sigma-70 factor (ECF subfamily)
VRGASATSSAEADLARQREVVEAFLAAARGGDLEALVAVLDPDVVLRADRGAVDAGAPGEVRGAPAVARRAAKGRARAARAALVNGTVGVVVAPRGRLLMVLGFTNRGGKIVEIDAIADPDRLRRLDLSYLDD